MQGAAVGLVHIGMSGDGGKDARAGKSAGVRKEKNMKARMLSARKEHTGQRTLADAPELFLVIYSEEETQACGLHVSHARHLLRQAMRLSRVCAHTFKSLKCFRTGYYYYFRT